MESPIETRFLSELAPMLETLGWKVERQVRFAKYTADFLVTVKNRRFVVEADGHSFHEKSREQAEKDRARDRWFLRQGIITLRYLGGEIRRNAEACSTDAIRTIAAAMKIGAV